MLVPQVTTVDDAVVTWRLPDPQRQLDDVRLWCDFDLGDTTFAAVDGGWELSRVRCALPEVDRLEYQFEVTRDDRTESTLDPGNPRRVGGAFGDHSWLALGYRPPAWLAQPSRPGTRRCCPVAGTPVGDVDVVIWSPAGTAATEQVPLLLCHDGPEMDALGELTRFVAAMIGLGRIPPVRVALLTPGSRDERYAANPAYAAALVDAVLPALRKRVPTRGRPVLMGQSLGAVAALHAEWTHPGTFAGLLLQSGSFFTPELDAHESDYAHWEAVTDFVATVHRADHAPSDPAVGICFGIAEENAANNRRLAATLTARGVPVAVGEVRDGHTFTCWRDLLDPNLSDLLALVLTEEES
ncbi:MAG: alpha/beta hydrolase [Propionibacteriaceae bacterium]